MSLLCVPIRAFGLPELKKLIKKAEKKADIIEIWIDSLPSSKNPAKPSEILKDIKKPVIIVNKNKKERGDFKGREKERMEILEKFGKAGASYVDVSMGTKKTLLDHLLKSKRGKTKIILSHHDFIKTPPLGAMKKLRDRGFALGADMVKIVTFANKIDDNLKILDLLTDSVKRRKPCIAFCMGKKGVISRALAPQYGSYIIYTALDKKHKTAPGQLTVDEYRKISSLLKL